MRGFNEEGTTTTPFDMVVRNEMSRYHLCLEALRRAPQGEARRRCRSSRTAATMLDRHRGYIREHFEDMPEVRDWRWSARLMAGPRRSCCA